jgi:hypothetical protein
MVITRVGVVSVAKIAGVLYAGIGLIIGGFFSLLGMAGFAGGLASESAGGAFAGALFGIGAVIVLPIVYGIFGFIGTLICAFLFNLAAGITGGVEVEVKGGGSAG